MFGPAVANVELVDVLAFPLGSKGVNRALRGTGDRLDFWSSCRRIGASIGDQGCHDVGADWRIVGFCGV